MDKFHKILISDLQLPLNVMYLDRLRAKIRELVDEHVERFPRVDQIFANLNFECCDI